MSSARLGCLLVQASSCVQQNLFPFVLNNNRHLGACFYQQSRGRRRSTKPPSWFVRRKKFTQDKDLTAENRQFLKEVVADHYENLTSPLKDGPWERHNWNTETKRTGVLAIKLGIIPQWTAEGKKFFTTLLQVIDNHVIRYTPPEKFAGSGGWKPWWQEKYGTVVVGALSCDPHLFTKEYNNLFLEAGVPPKRRLTRFLVTPNAAVQPGTPLDCTHFRVGDVVDCQAKTIEHGFQGVVKRWGMKGMPASHGVTKSHRKMGSTGGGGDKDGIWKGKKMPGHMGSDWRHLRGLKIWRINTKYNVLYVHGQNIPGETHTFVRVMDTVLTKRKPETPPPMPTCYPEDLTEPLPEELFDEQLFNFSNNSIMYEDDK